MIRNDLQMYSPKVFESILIEIIVPNKKSCVLGTTFNHPSMKLYKFNNDFLKPLLNKIKKRQRLIFNR